jgi:hypothetical protein
MTCRRLIFGCLVIAVFVSGAGTPAGAQEAVPRVEVGPDISFFQVRYWPTDTGAGGHVTVALKPRLAIETRVRWFPSETFPDLARGGKTLQVFAGVRATFASRGPFTLYGLLLPGVIHFSNAVTAVDRTVDRISFRSGPLTHFALDMGMGAAVRLQRRWSAHVDWTGPLYGVRGFSELSSFPPAAERGIQEVTADPAVQAAFQFNAGVSYRMGSLPHRAEAPQRRGWLVGGHVGSVTYAPYVPRTGNLITTARVGGFTSYPLMRWMDADGGFDVFLRTDRGHSSNEGGRISQAFAGVKAGRRAGRVGYFGKIRAGVQSHSEGLVAVPSPGQPVYGRIYRPAFDIGAVIETTIARRLLWRVDVGDVISLYPSRTIPIDGQPSKQYAMPMTDTITVSSGLAWRFGG